MDLLRMNALLVANRESPHPFNMKYFTWGSRHPCGTPACLLGNYAARRDLQNDFLIASDGDLSLTGEGQWHSTPTVFVRAARHFDLKASEIHELFSPGGCDHAREDRAKALAYVEAFIARKLAEHPMPDEPDEEEPLEEPDEEEVTA